MKRRFFVLCAALFGFASCSGNNSTTGGDGGSSSDRDVAIGDAARRDRGQCAPSQSCSVRFSYPAAGESSVGLKGSFDNWGAGVDLTLDGDQWVTELTLNHGDRVLYKFVIDGNDWVPDPNNPEKTQDGFDNSIKTVSCPAVCIDAGVPDQGTYDFPPRPDLGDVDAYIPPPPGSCPPKTPVTDFRKESIYFLLTTRFFDGDASNNYYNRDRIVIGDPTWRGDFKGLIQKLDYIKEMGFTAIWITPVVENRSGLDYHGYHGYDFTKVDPRLESPGATFQDLICEMHKRDMRLVLDIVINHSSNYGLRGKVWNKRAPIKYYRESGAFPSKDPNYPFKTNLGDYRSANREDDDNPLAPQVFHDWDPDGTKTITCPVCGNQIKTSGFSGWQNHDANHFFNIDANTLDSTWYHQDGFMAGGDWENPKSLQKKHMAGDTIDLNTEHPTVKKYIIDAYKRYLDMGVDALRIDTVKHLERGNLLEYVNAFKAHRPGLFVFGENLVKGTGWGTCLDASDNGPAEIRPWWYTRTTNDECGGGKDDSGFSVLDFSLMSTFRDNISQGRFSGLSAIFSRDHLYGDATKLITFIDNHDIGPQNDWKYRFAGTDSALASALNLIFLVRGIPCLYYGTEIRFKAGKEIDGTDAPHDNSGRAYFGDHLLPANIGATKSHKFFQQIKRLNQIRKAAPALQMGVMEHFGDSDQTFHFVRNYKNGQSYAAVGLAQSDAQITLNGVKNGSYVDAVTGNTITVSGGSISFFVKAGSAGVYILDGPGKIGSDGVYLR
jgi:glycosidase